MNGRLVREKALLSTTGKYMERWNAPSTFLYEGPSRNRIDSCEQTSSQSRSEKSRAGGRIRIHNRTVRQSGYKRIGQE